MKFRNICLFLLPLTGFVATSIARPPALFKCKQEIVYYHDSGEYLKDINRIELKAKHYLAKTLKLNSAKSKKLAIVLDIDETTLSNYNTLKKIDFGALNANNLSDDDPSIEPTKRLYQYALKNHVAVFFITGRPEQFRKLTEVNLKKVGFTKWQHIYFRSYQKPLRYASTILYKSAMRKKICAEGYNIVINVGDQESDLKGGYSDATFKYPNYIYFEK